MVEYDKYIILFANCILCKGASRTMLYDPQRNDYELLPNELYDVLTTSGRERTAGEIAAHFNEEDRHHFDEYLHFLHKKEYIFFCTREELDCFPQIDDEWEWPALITNAIIDVRKNSKHNLKKIFGELDELGCEHLQIRCYDPLPLFFFQKNLAYLYGTIINNVELLVCYNPKEADNVTFYSPLLNYGSISSLVVHSAPVEKRIAQKTDQQFISVKEEITGEHHCGLIGEKYFSLTLPHILESKTRNTCLHKKISVDAEGHIRNCPSLPQSYGHVRTDSLVEVVKEGKIKELWDLHKGQVEVCRDCEFRMICTDCRAYRSAENIYSKPGKCNYDPYTNTWGNQS
ncbi:MAG: grasp-with-spasm system SPASM domain peptide maturase [Bacteroidetes bacterium]|nr:grasp-with-spasm system SPASM domain peptide maturase [Bacteroidota bacterium]